MAVYQTHTILPVHFWNKNIRKLKSNTRISADSISTEPVKGVKIQHNQPTSKHPKTSWWPFKDRSNTRSAATVQWGPAARTVAMSGKQPLVAPSACSVNRFFPNYGHNCYIMLRICISFFQMFHTFLVWSISP